MSNTSIERMLELNTRIEKGITESKPKMNGGKSVASQRDLDRLIEDFDRHFITEDKQMIKSYRKRNSTIIIREMQIKSSVKHH